MVQRRGSKRGAKAKGQQAPARSAKRKSSATKHAGAAKTPRRLVVVRPEPIDEFGAAGGMPVSRSAGSDRSAAASATRELSWKEFDREVQALARTIARRFKPEVVVGLAHGGVFVGDALAQALKLRAWPVHVTRRSRDRASHAAGAISDEMPAALTGKRVLIVDDIASSGDSLEFALRLARARKPRALATAALVSRPGRYEPDFSAFCTDTFFVFPWDYQSLVDEARFTPRAAD
ncbi:MAG: phosphoribosyltransferase family protein [Myxococcota bacterium]